MKIYRIYAEEVLNTDIHGILTGWGIDSYSFLNQQGYWKGIPEASFVLEIFDFDDSKGNQIHSAAEMIRVASGQELVYVVELQARAIKSIVQVAPKLDLTNLAL